MTTTSATTAAELERVQRHTVRTLVVTQAIGGVGLSAAIAVAALLAKDVTGSESMSGLAQTGQVLGAAVGAAVLAGYMARHGRRPGLSLGYLVGALGATLCIVAGTVRSFPVLLVGAVLLGAVTASNQQTRYAATDLAVPARRGRDLSTVVWSTTIGSVLGPNLTGPGGAVADWLHLPTRTGPFVISVVTLVTTAVVVAVRLRPDPLLLAREARLRDPAGDGAVEKATDLRTAWRVVRHTPLVLAAALGLGLTHAVMVSVMVMTPIHMDHGGASLEIIGLVISAHVLGMYAVSPLVGRLVDRYGSPPVLGVGGLILLAALLLAGLSAPGRVPVSGSGCSCSAWGGRSAPSVRRRCSPPPRRRCIVPGCRGWSTCQPGSPPPRAGRSPAPSWVRLGYSWLNVGAAVLAFAVVLVAVAAGRRASEADEHLAGVAAGQE